MRRGPQFPDDGKNRTSKPLPKKRVEDMSEVELDRLYYQNLQKFREAMRKALDPSARERGHDAP